MAGRSTSSSSPASPRCSLASSCGPGHLRLVEALLEGGPVGVALPDAEDALAELLRFVLAIGDLSQVAQQGDREVVFAGLLRSDHLVDPFPGRISLGREVIETLGVRCALASALAPLLLPATVLLAAFPFQHAGVSRLQQFCRSPRRGGMIRSRPSLPAPAAPP